MAEVACCDGCRFSIKDDDLPEGIIFCRRYPPGIPYRAAERAGNVRFPTVEKDWWCGEFKPAGEA